jgi:hypothetical protein
VPCRRHGLCRVADMTPTPCCLLCHKSEGDKNYYQIVEAMKYHSKSITCNPNFIYHYDIPCDACPAHCSMSPNPNPNPNPNPLPWLLPLLLPPPRLRNSSYPEGNSAPLLLAPSVPRPCGDKSSNKKMSHNNVLIFIEEKKRHKLTSNSCAMALASVEWFSAQA